MTNLSSVAGMPAQDTSTGEQVSLIRSNLKSVFGQGAGRLSMILLGVSFTLMFGYGGYKLFFSKPRVPPEAPGAPVTAPNARSNDPMAPVSTDDAQRRAVLNGQTAKAAAANGKGYIAPPVVSDRGLDPGQGAAQAASGPAVGSSVLNRLPEPRTVSVATPPPQPVAPAPAPNPQVGGNGGQQTAQAQSGGPPPSGQQQGSAGLDPDVKKAIIEQLKGVMDQSKEPRRAGFITVYASDPRQGPQGQGQAGLPTQGGQGGGSIQQAIAAGQQGQSAPTKQGPPKEAFLTAGDGCYAETDNAINSDDTLIVLATIHGCVTRGGVSLDNGKLIGKLEKAQEQVRVSFNKLTIPSRKTGSIPISAIAVTEDEMRSGVGKDVDKHTFSRYFSLGISSLLSGYGKAAQQVSGTTVITGGSTTVTTAPLTAQQRTEIALGEVGTAFAGEIKRGFNQPPTITSPARMGIGVLFVDDVFLDEKK